MNGGVNVTRMVNGYLTMLRDATSKPIGDHKIPPGASPPYGILYVIPGGEFYGTLAEPHDDVQCVVQITSVGASREMAMAMADLVRRETLKRNADGFANPIEGVDDRWPDTGPGGVDPDIRPTSELYSQSDRYVLCAFGDMHDAPS